MNFLKILKDVINKVFYSPQKYNSISSKENAPSTSKIAIIDTRNLDINRVLTDEEKLKLEAFIKEVDLSINKIIEYGNEDSRKVSHYMEISRKRLNQNINRNNEVLKDASSKNIISQKLDIEFNNLEIRSILEDLQNIKRECELRIIALEEKGQEEIKKGRRLIFFLESKVDSAKINSINNAIERIKTTIKIIEMLSRSITNELIATMQEEKSLDRYIENNNSEENTKIVNEMLSKRFEKQKKTLRAVYKIGRDESEFPLSLLNATIENKNLNEKIKIIVQSKKYIDLYVEKNKKDFYKSGGLFEQMQNKLEPLWQQIETNYFDRELWAKKQIDGYDLENSLLNNIETLMNIFEEEIPEEFKRKFYRVKFYHKALYYEHNKSDIDQKFYIENETERKYYLEFVSDLIDKIHRESDDADLLKFMDKNLKIKDIDKILEDYIKLIALLRIEKYGREGLFTLRLFDKSLIPDVLRGTFGDTSVVVSADYMRSISSQDVSLQDISELNGIINFYINEFDIKYLFDNISIKISTNSRFTKEILKLWSETPKTITSFYKFINCKQTNKLPQRVVIPDLFDDIEFSKEIPDEIKSLTYSGSCMSVKDYTSKSDEKDTLRKYNKCTSFHAETEQEINRRIRLDKDKSEENRKWKTNYVKVNLKNEKIGEAEEYKINLAEVICRFSIALETMMKGKISKIDIRDKILQSDDFNIGQKNQSYSYFELMKELTRCLLSGKGKELLETVNEYLEYYNMSEDNKSFEIIDEMSDFVANYINSRINIDYHQSYNYSIPNASDYEKREIFKKRGLKSKTTAFSAFLGGKDDLYWARGEGYPYARKIDATEGTSKILKENYENTCSLRPCIYFYGRLYIPVNYEGVKRTDDGVLELEYGYYPQELAPNEIHEKLELAYKDGKLIKTKNTYSVLDKIENKNMKISKLQEYEYIGKRYVRFDGKFPGNNVIKLLNEDTIDKNNISWFEVQPVKWWVDEKTKYMITEKLIISGVPFDCSTRLPIMFISTDINGIINRFSEDLEQSNNVVLLGEQILYRFLTQKEKKVQQSKKLIMNVNNERD